MAFKPYTKPPTVKGGPVGQSRNLVRINNTQQDLQQQPRTNISSQRFQSITTAGSSSNINNTPRANFDEDTIVDCTLCLGLPDPVDVIERSEQRLTFPPPPPSNVIDRSQQRSLLPPPPPPSNVIVRSDQRLSFRPPTPPPQVMRQVPAVQNPVGHNYGRQIIPRDISRIPPWQFRYSNEVNVNNINNGINNRSESFVGGGGSSSVANIAPPNTHNNINNGINNMARSFVGGGGSSSVENIAPLNTNNNINNRINNRCENFMVGVGDGVGGGSSSVAISAPPNNFQPIGSNFPKNMNHDINNGATVMVNIGGGEGSFGRTIPTNPNIQLPYQDFMSPFVIPNIPTAAYNFARRRIQPEQPRNKLCTVCGATETPLWRNGPSGSKTLCNACGIRYRKWEKRVNGGDYDYEAPRF